jgi:hypothetical protein
MLKVDICDGVKLMAFDTRLILEAENPYYRCASVTATGVDGGLLA